MPSVFIRGNIMNTVSASVTTAPKPKATTTGS